MSALESEIYDFLKRFPRLFVSVTEISKSVGPRKRFNEDRNWARPVLRRMEMDGCLESNPFGEYRLKHRPDETTSFKHALSMPGAALGDTAIISIDPEETDTRIDNSPTTHTELTRRNP